MKTASRFKSKTIYHLIIYRSALIISHLRQSVGDAAESGNIFLRIHLL